MSKARPQSARKRAQRIMMGLQNPAPNSSKRQGMRMQVIEVNKPEFPKKKGRKSNHQKYLESLPHYMNRGQFKIIYHKK
jgi:hypothetical protein